MTRINQRLVAGVETGNFMSLLLAIVDPRKKTLQYVNAGHPGLVHCRADGLTVLEKTGMVLGVVGEQVYHESPTIPLASGDLLFLYTDGVDEAKAKDRSVFGSSRLESVLARARSSSAEDVLIAMGQALQEHVGDGAIDDDYTMIAVKVS